MFKYMLDKLVRAECLEQDLDDYKKYHGNACEVHHLLAELFDIESGSKDFRVQNNILYREILRKEGVSLVYSLLVQSDIPISKKRVEEFGFVITEEEVIELKSDTMYKFFTRVCPYVRDDSQKRVFIQDKKERENWVRNKLSHNEECEIILLNETDLYKTCMKKENLDAVVLNGREYCGVIKVKDLNAFTEILNKGIGPCKCYGYGMLEVEEVC